MQSPSDLLNSKSAIIIALKVSAMGVAACLNLIISSACKKRLSFFPTSIRVSHIFPISLSFRRRPHYSIWIVDIVYFVEDYVLRVIIRLFTEYDIRAVKRSTYPRHGHEEPTTGNPPLSCRLRTNGALIRNPKTVVVNAKSGA